MLIYNQNLVLYYLSIEKLKCFILISSKIIYITGSAQVVDAFDGGSVGALPTDESDVIDVSVT